MTSDTPAPETPWQIFLIFLRLGLTSFGGPVAHLGYFRDEFVSRRRWLSESAYADLIALCQFLPGPASSQAGLAIGQLRGGHAGALAAWLGFTLPSAILLILFALGVTAVGFEFGSDDLRGLKTVAAAVVAQAVWGMGRNFCTDLKRLTLMALACLAMLLASFTAVQVIIIIAAGLTGRFLFATDKQQPDREALPVRTRRRTQLMLLALFFGLLVLLPLLASVLNLAWLSIFDAFYRTGALVFGGGHVVLPLLQAEVVPSGWIDGELFVAGYGAAQAVPGPLFTFSAYLGTAMSFGPGGIPGGLIALIAIFLPAYLLIAGCLPFWENLRRNAGMQAALSGINAAVVGLLLAALYDPVLTTAIRDPVDVLMALAALAALMIWRVPVWLVVLLSGLAGIAVSLAF